MSLFSVQFNFDKSSLSKNILNDISHTIAESFNEDIEVSWLLERLVCKLGKAFLYFATGVGFVLYVKISSMGNLSSGTL